jgi:hypothetical protein
LNEITHGFPGRPEKEYTAINSTSLVSAENFLKKLDNWEGFMELGDSLMKCADASFNQTEASSSDFMQEVHAQGKLRHHGK